MKITMAEEEEKKIQAFPELEVKSIGFASSSGFAFDGKQTGYSSPVTTYIP